MIETASDLYGSGPCQNRAAPSDTFSDKDTTPAHYGDAVTPNQAEVSMILIMGAFICNYTSALTGKSIGTFYPQCSHCWMVIDGWKDYRFLYPLLL